MDDPDRAGRLGGVEPHLATVVRQIDDDIETIQRGLALLRRSLGGHSAIRSLTAMLSGVRYISQTVSPSNSSTRYPWGLYSSGAWVIQKFGPSRSLADGACGLAWS